MWDKKALEPQKSDRQSQKNSKTSEEADKILLVSFSTFLWNWLKNISHFPEEYQMDNMYSKCMPRDHILLGQL